MHDALSPGINWWGIGNAYKDTPALGWYLLTFAVFVWMLVRFLRKPLLLFLETRSLDIQRAIEEAKMAKELAEAKIEEYEVKLKSLDGEIAKLKAEFIKQGELEKTAFEKSALNLAEQITKEAQDNLASEVRHALMSLKSDMADAIISSARNQLEQVTGSSAEDGLKRVFNKGVSELRN